MKKNFLKVMTAIAAVTMAFEMSACNDDDNVVDTKPEQQAEATVEDDGKEGDTGLESNPEDETTVCAATSTLGLSPEMEDLVGYRFLNQCNGFGAEVIIADANQLYSHKEEAKQAYDEGKVIVEVNVDGRAHNEFWNDLGVTTYLDDNVQGGMVALRKGVYFKMDEVSDLCASTLNPLVGWINKNLEATRAVQGMTSQSDKEKVLSDLIDKSEYTQVVTDTKWVEFNNYQICDVTWSDPDRITRPKTYIEAEIRITPLYVFEDNGDVAGDYYFVTTNVTSHNNPLVGTYKVWHGWVRTWAHAFYGKRIRFGAQMLSPGGWEMSNVKFLQTPTPVSTSSSSKYDWGYTQSINAGGQIGYAEKTGVTGAVNLGYSFSWSNNHSVTVPDQNIVMSTNTNNGSVNYEYFNNINMEDELDRAVPAIARGDQSARSSWCWHVTGTKDDSTTRYRMRFWYEGVYGWVYRHATWTCEGWECETGGYKSVFQFYVNHPNRARNGMVTFTSNCGPSKVISDLEFVKHTDKGTETVMTSECTLGTDDSKTFNLPVGTYEIKYTVSDRDDWDIEPIKYTTGTFEVTTKRPAETNSAHGKKL